MYRSVRALMSSTVIGESCASHAIRCSPSGEAAITSARQEPSPAATSSSANQPAARMAPAISSLSVWCSQDSFAREHSGGRPLSWQKNRTRLGECLACTPHAHSGQVRATRGETL
ncbi:hypothetical protein BGK72_01455 [Streptomyces agglomeratus]|nr:hypothetical protein BGK72_01455 [Streptomyces agglomeratus]